MFIKTIQQRSLLGDQSLFSHDLYAWLFHNKLVVDQRLSLFLTCHSTYLFDIWSIFTIHYHICVSVFSMVLYFRTCYGAMLHF